MLENLNHSIAFFVVAVMPEWADCEESWQVKPGTPDARISCKARMFPPATTSVWSIGKKPNRTILTNDQATEDNTYKAKVNVSVFPLCLCLCLSVSVSVLLSLSLSFCLCLRLSLLQKENGFFIITLYVLESWWEHLRIHLDHW